jgi:pyruvate,water dikinase
VTVPSPNPLLLPLDDLSATLDLVGGKGASLASTSRAGFPVPTGFHITTHAYREFLGFNGLDREIERALGSPGAKDSVSRQSRLETLRRAIDSGSLSDELVTELRIAYAGLGDADHAVAVRSSATAEDLPEASFAGQQDTFLNVRGIDAVMEAIKVLLGFLVDGAGGPLPRAAEHRSALRSHGRGGTDAGSG